MSILDQLLHDLRAEGDDLDRLVADLDVPTWERDVPAEGWTIRDTVGHLLWTDRVSLVAIEGPAAFEALVTEQFGELGEDAVDAMAHRTAQESGVPALLATWRARRAELADALATVPDGTKLPWFGPPMSPASMATARLMETWAHGQDVADALGVTRTPTHRLRHVAHIAVRTRGFVHAVHELPPPTAEVRVELTAPDGDTWTWGPADADQHITGTALDWCLLATQRSHRDDTDLVARGEDAERWLGIVQAFAGPPGPGRQPGQRGAA